MSYRGRDGSIPQRVEPRRGDGVTKVTAVTAADYASRRSAQQFGLATSTSANRITHVATATSLIFRSRWIMM